MRIPTSTRTLGLLLAALLLAACGAPQADPPTATAPSGETPPSYPGPISTESAPGYPAPATPESAPGYPAPATPAPNASPYPAPTQSGAAPGDTQSVAATAADTPFTSASVVATYPHDRQAYTQGLVYIGGDKFYEGTGLEGRSSLREVALATGVVSRQVNLDEVAPLPNGDTYFGEGVAVVGDRIFQLTWQECVGFIYDLEFTLIREFSYPKVQGNCATEGWGLTYDGQRLIMSNGTATLLLVDPAATEQSGTLAVVGQLNVREASGAPVFQLNELEMVNGEIFANIYTTELIARIDPATGVVNSFLDLSNLRPLLSADPNTTSPEVLNGIAYDAEGDRLFVTGKYWPSLFEIDLPVAQAYLPVAIVPLRTITLRHWS